MDTQVRILQGALRLFTTLGYSGVTMERIAQESGVGKATLYRRFPSKEALILASIAWQADQIGARIDRALADAALSPRERVAAFLNPIVRFVSGIRPDALEDVRRSAPEAYAAIEANRQRLIMQNFERIICEGKETGVFRQDVNGALVANVLIGAISRLSTPEAQREVNLPFGDLLNEVIGLLWEGALSEQGRRGAEKNP